MQLLGVLIAIKLVTQVMSHHTGHSVSTNRREKLRFTHILFSFNSESRTLDNFRPTRTNAI